MSLNEWRHALVDARLESVGNPGVNLDRSMTGAGKSYADIAAVQRAWRALLVVPTHENCRELVNELERANVDVIAYPARITGEPGNPQANCWNPDADRAESIGLAVVRAVCSSCRLAQECRRHGYLGHLMAATKSPVVVATHARAEWMGLGELGAGRDYWSIHEGAVSVLRPTAELTPADLNGARSVLLRLLSDPRWLNYFGGGRDRDEREVREAQYQFAWHLADTADWLVHEALSATTTQELTPLKIMRRPAGIERVLFTATSETAVAFSGQPWKVLIALAAGELCRLALLVDKHFTKENVDGNPPAVEALPGSLAECDSRQHDDLVL